MERYLTSLKSVECKLKHGVLFNPLNSKRLKSLTKAATVRVMENEVLLLLLKVILNGQIPWPRNSTSFSHRSTYTNLEIYVQVVHNIFFFANKQSIDLTRSDECDHSGRLCRH